jgi:hypothetical protein
MGLDVMRFDSATGNGFENWWCLEFAGCCGKPQQLQVFVPLSRSAPRLLRTEHLARRELKAASKLVGAAHSGGFDGI